MSVKKQILCQEDQTISIVEHVTTDYSDEFQNYNCIKSIKMYW